MLKNHRIVKHLADTTFGAIRCLAGAKSYSKAKKFKTITLLVDQNIMKAFEVSDFMYFLEMGQIKQEGPKEDFEADIREIIRDSLIAR